MFYVTISLVSWPAVIMAALAVALSGAALVVSLRRRPGPAALPVEEPVRHVALTVAPVPADDEPEPEPTVLPDGTKMWRRNGRLHRRAGLPAIEHADGRREFYCNGLFMGGE